ncbi:MAG: LamG domain-containing protein [Niabella sp.]
MRYSIVGLLFTCSIVLGGCKVAQYSGRAATLEKKITGSKGLVAFWNFRDTSGFPFAGTARQVKLNAAGPAKFVNDGPLSGRAIELDGKTSYWYIRAENAGMLDLNSNAVTVIAWVSWSGGTGFVAGKWNEYTDGGKRQYGLFVSLPYYNGDSQVCGHISKNGGPTKPFPYSIDYSASPQKVPLNTWVCAAFTYDGKYIKSYLNGIFQPRGPELIQRTAGFLEAYPDGLTQAKNPYYYPDGMGNNGSDFTVGAVQLKKGMGNFFKGRIGGIALFNRALNDKEMAQVSVMP